MSKRKLVAVFTLMMMLLGAYGLGMLTYRNNLPPLNVFRNIISTSIQRTSTLDLFIDTKRKVEVDCPVAGERTMVILALGQSNAANRSNSHEPPYTSMPEVVNFYNGKCYRISGPLLGGTTNGNPEQNGNPVWPMVGEQLIGEKKADRVVIALFAVGGTAIKRWVEEPEFLTTLEQTLISLNQAQLKPTHIVWFQGENDSAEHTKASDYKAYFGRLVAFIRAHQVAAPIFPSITTMCAENPINPELRLAQQQLANETPGISPGPDTDQLGFAYRFDGCHFSFEGRQALAKAWAKSLSVTKPHQ